MSPLKPCVEWPSVGSIIYTADKQACRHIGTAFIVSHFDPGNRVSTKVIIATAAHVADEMIRVDDIRLWERLHDPLFPAPAGTSYFKHDFRFITPQKGNIPLNFVVERIWLDKGWRRNCDIAYLGVSLRDRDANAIPAGMVLNSFGPPKGAPIAALGYCDGILRHPFALKDLSMEAFAASFRMTSGEVMTAHDEPRVSALTRWPSFQVSTALNSGMSGGPIVQTGERFTPACGVISSDDGDNAIGSGEAATAARIWPSMYLGTDIHLRDPDTLEDNMHPSLLELERVGVLHDIRRASRHVRWDLRYESDLEGMDEADAGTIFWNE